MKKILIVDDLSENLKIARMALAGKCEVFTAKNAEEAIEFLQNNKNKIDGVLTDLFMPSGKNWLDFVSGLKPMKGFESDYRNFKKMANLVYTNPGGLGVAKFCHENNIPFLILTQGDRHKGEFGSLRYKMIATGFLTGDWDCLPGMMPKKNGIDKSNKKDWVTSFNLLF